MNRLFLVFFFIVFSFLQLDIQGQTPKERVKQVSQIPGLIAFWDFDRSTDGAWTAYNDPQVVQNPYPVYLRHIGSKDRHRFDRWPYSDEQSRLRFDTTGPFGHAVEFNKGYLYAEVPRTVLDQTPLDISGRTAFTMAAWVRFDGPRHLICGIWDEGGWNKYGGRRQYALFGGLFGSDGVIGHVSTTGAASYPQSNAPGSQYARMRAIDGQRIRNSQWVCVAMTFDPANSLLKMYCNGILTETSVTDPVENDVYRYTGKVSSNPMRFDWPIWSARHFTLKFNGYNVKDDGVYEQYLDVDIANKQIQYGFVADKDTKFTIKDYRFQFDVNRSGKSLLSSPLISAATPGKKVAIPADVPLQVGDVIFATLEKRESADSNVWKKVGSTIKYPLVEGAPFTFCRALGLGNEEPNHGGKISIDGVAVFNRVLEPELLKAISFCKE